MFRTSAFWLLRSALFLHLSCCSKDAFHFSELAGHTSQVVMEFTNFKDDLYPSLLNFFKMAHTIFGVIIFRDFAAPSLQNDTFDLQTRWPDQPVLSNGKHSK